jgi:hypothetical protein
MNAIIFRKTGHTLLNNGIIGLVSYLEKVTEGEYDSLKIPFEYKLCDNALTIECEELPTLLDELYYIMGTDVYDTATQKQKDNAKHKKDCNAYYDEEKDAFITFPRMNTYGLTHLLTNNAQGIMRKDENWTNVKKLTKDNPAFLNKVEHYFAENKLKLLAKVYLNEPYTKISRLEPLKRGHLESGGKQCFLTGESFKELVDITNISPFFSGIENFSSHFKANDKKISWKAKYLSMFAPVHSYYHYSSKIRDTLYIYLVNSNNLLNLKDALTNLQLHKTKAVLEVEEFESNIMPAKNISKDKFTERNETGFMLTYSIYNKVISKYGGLKEKKEIGFLKQRKLPPISIDVIRAESFASTMRPNEYQQLNKLDALMNIYMELEQDGIDIAKWLSSFKILKPSESSAQNRFRLERQLRDKVCGEILNLKSIISSTEELLYRCFNYSCANDYVGYKSYNNIQNFLISYESKIKTMDGNLQELALTLGKQIGMKIRNQDSGLTEAQNAKKGRNDLINLRKSRTYKQFIDELIRVDFKYGLTIKDELSLELKEQNFYQIKQFIIIGALNILNPAIKPKTETNKKDQ